MIQKLQENELRNSRDGAFGWFIHVELILVDVVVGHPRRGDEALYNGAQR
jgi:hypothetical protein